ncbi:IclR family transcriptional regulator [Salicibibacter cibarius]|uniref:IclR family transcriptional regulator n=1 Tax=Salicibibacter cibarius TaxID=2743000 RepID=A0A7T6Z449_9BACI|nr:IclR family transcriptional regulator [Salicibibacter cibarius]QQK76448.1 IclR family transcriptional regulator [Salicibibacter cibarius]
MSKTNETEKGKRKYSVPAVEIAFRILTLLSRKKFSQSNLTEIANALELQPTTCYRVLQQLREHSVVHYNKRSKQYSLGPYLVVLGERAKENSLDITIILPYLEELSERTGLTSVLVNRIGKTRTTIVAKSEGGDFGVNVSVGRHFSIVDGAYGKCLLAYMEEEASNELLQEVKEQRPLSDQEIDQLKADFPVIRDYGYATNFGESINGIFGVAAPIFNMDDNVDMTINLFGMTAQYDEHELIPKGELLKDAADRISAKIKGQENNLFV